MMVDVQFPGWEWTSSKLCQSAGFPVTILCWIKHDVAQKKKKKGGFDADGLDILLQKDILRQAACKNECLLGPKHLYSHCLPKKRKKKHQAMFCFMSIHKYEVGFVQNRED